jgi:hypothetical protein
MAIAPNFGSIVPSQSQQLLQSNYLQFNNSTSDFAQQYLPEIYEQEVERYGNRTLSGFLRMVGAEMPMTSDQVIWSEQNRLHVAYDGCFNDDANGITIPVGAGVVNVISPGQTIVLMDAAGNELKAVVTSSNPGTGKDLKQLTGTELLERSRELLTLVSTLRLLNLAIHQSLFVAITLLMDLTWLKLVGLK